MVWLANAWMTASGLVGECLDDGRWLVVECLDDGVVGGFFWILRSQPEDDGRWLVVEFLDDEPGLLSMEIAR